MVKFTFLVENKTYKGSLAAEAGLSVYIETETQKILFDAGVTDAFADNAEKLGIDLSEVNFAVVSHGHYDHTGGIRKFCEINDRAHIFISWEALDESYAMHGDKMADKPCSIRWSEEDMEVIKPRLNFTAGCEVLSSDMVISGFIPPVKEFEPTDKFYKKDGEDFYEDDMAHEQFLVIRDRNEKGGSNGLYIFSGCSHKGVVSVLKYAKEMYPYDPIKCFVAGMHLCNADKETRSKTIEELDNYHIEKLLPVHCTGMDAIIELKEHFGDRCIIANTGDTYEF